MKRMIRSALIAILALGLATAARAAVVQSKTGPVNVESLAKLDNPWGSAFLPDGRLLITEKPGRLRIFADGKLSEPVSGAPKVHYRGQGGLLDVAVDPGFASNKLVYLSYSEPADPQPEGGKDVKGPGDNRLGTFFNPNDHVLTGGAVARAKLDGNSLTDLKVIWRQTPKTFGRGHFGGHMAFAPDGKLFISCGERQRFEPAQDLAATLGKFVRINPDGSIPQDNPFVNQQGARPDVFSYGNRNPLSAAINPKTGELWAHEMGPKGGDELNIIRAGKNYGWPLVCYGTNYDDSPIPSPDTKPEFEKPVKYWNPVISPSGMIFYNGSKFPQWKGNILLGGLSSRALIRLTLDGDKVADEDRLNMGFRVRDVIEAPDGAVLLLSDGNNGELLKLTPAEGAGK